MTETPLQDGDEVELRFDRYPGFVAKGTVKKDEQGCCLCLGPFPLISDGKRTLQAETHLKVTKMAPRPFYVNHERTEPIDGDIARDADSDSRLTYVRTSETWFAIMNGMILSVNTTTPGPPGPLPEKLKLLVDGDTGQVVP